MILRDARPEDMSWITHSWLASFADSDTAMLVTPRAAGFGAACAACGAWVPARRHGKSLPPVDKYWRGQRALVEQLIRLGRVRVAESDGLLDGFLAVGDNSAHPSTTAVVHYVYTRLSARGCGVAKALVAELGSPTVVIYTHRSRGVRGARLPAGWVYDPYEITRSLMRAA